MTPRRDYRLLAIAVATGRIAYVYFVGDELTDWRLSRVVPHNTRAAVSTCRVWISQLEPDVIVTECTMTASRKSRRTLEIMRAISQVACDEPPLNMQVVRPRAQPNKFAEARVLRERFPEIAPWVPRERRPWETEHRNMTYFEALTLALVVIDGK